MSNEPLRFASELDASRDTIWASISTMRGVNYELGPLFRMTSPSHADRASLVDAPRGVCAFQSYLLLFCVLPIDRHALTLIDVDIGHGFLEDSTSLLQRRWRHERRLISTPEGHCRITDEILFVPRLSIFEPLVRTFVRTVFTHRHARLRKRFGGRPLDAGR